MIGNDIVDLALANEESNWKRKGFLSKIFSEREQFLISDSNNPETMVWNLWSRKEAAYKIYNRETGVRAYIPLRFECFDIEIIDGIYFGHVSIEEKLYFTKTEITTQFVNTVAVTKWQDFDKIKIIKDRTTITKRNGIPSYFDSKLDSLKPISISNHGQFEQIVMLN